MRNGEWLQRLLYILMAVLSTYIIYKGGEVLVREADLSEIVPDEWKKGIEDAAVSAYAPAYSAAVRGDGTGNWISEWMEQLVPIYTYMAERPQETEAGGEPQETGESETEAEQTQEPETASGQTQEPEAVTGQTESAEDGADTYEAAEASAPGTAGISPELLSQLSDFDYLLNEYFTLDAGTTIDGELLNAGDLLNEDLTIEKKSGMPQILIYHTHSQETFADSREGVTEDSIVGMGEVLAELLRDKYGYQVIHDTGVYDLIDGVLDRSAAYDYARAAVLEILEQNPSIEVIIDLHRDGVEGEKFVTEIDGKPASMIMFFNGLSRDNQNQPLTWLENPYIRENLAFSLQLELKAREQYPGFTRNIYLKAQRYNLHLRPRSLLVEAGTQLNTVEEERNAMEPLAELLDQVLTGR
ncbi:MAG TPA: stage II sporulation protein P [Candidatus Choladousia intestinigallinarum]|nr:stage II sporulation protein P [Candidatus Choladousia intestinigallinarum]